MVLLLAMIVAIMTLRTLFLLVARKPVLAEVVQSSLSDWTRYGLRRWQFAMIGDALSAGDAQEPTEAAEIRVRYTVADREYFKDLQTVVRRGERPEPTLTLWYDPSDPARATDKGISWLGLAFGFALLAGLVTGLI
jgi:hypothetical protein